MEVFIAILLLFGAFSLDSASNDDADVDHAGSEFTERTNERQDPPGKGVEARELEYTQLEDCLADRHSVIYRDLTVRYQNEIDTETTGTSDSEEAYPDE